MIRTRDLLERLFWTFVSGFIGSLLGAPVLVAVIEAAADVRIDLSGYLTAAVAAVVAGLTAAANLVLLIARWRLSVLPNPGDGLPGLPTDDSGHSTVTLLLGAAVFFLLGALSAKAGLL